jgi:multiple antibiotic resistance protein
MFEIFLTAFVALFVIADPIGTAAVFMTLTQGYSEAAKRKMAIKAVLVAAAVLYAFAFFGLELLGAIGISMPSFQIAGGILIFLTALNMVMAHPEPSKSFGADRAGPYPDISVYPIALPLLVGPGAITTTILFLTKSNDDMGLQVAVLSAVAVVLILSLICFLMADRVGRIIGDDGNKILTRVIGLLLAALAVEFVVKGVKAQFFPV